MSAADPAKKFVTLLKKVRSQHASAAIPSVQPDPPDAFDGFVHELVFSVLLWEASTGQARAALKRVREQVCDCNELRVCTADDIAGALGEKYPLAHERAMRLRSSLNDIFQRQHALSLAHLPQLQKREARLYLESLEGLPIFASHRVALVHGLSHAIPVDERLRNLLAEHGAADAAWTIEHTANWLEKQIGVDDAPAVYAALQAWSDEEGHPPKRERHADEFEALLGGAEKAAQPAPAAKKPGRSTKAAKDGGGAGTGGGGGGGGGGGAGTGSATRKPKRSRSKSGG